jgi:serine/threonine-protein kinase
MSLKLASTKHETSGDGGERLGRYALLGQLGHGGMSTQHLAVAGGFGEFRKLCVIKELRHDLVQSYEFVKMFLAEAKLAARMNHPNIVQSLEAGQAGQRYFLAMEFLDGQPMNLLLRKAATPPRPSQTLLLQMICDVLAGLHYAHELCDFDELPLQIVHRDVSPSNVFVTYHGQVKLLDFGVAKSVHLGPHTATGVFKGKFGYAAPEQVSCAAVDRRADVFAVGVMLWEVLAGERFARGQVTPAMIDARLSGAEPRIALAAPEVPAELARICDRAIEVDTAQRYPTAEAFRADLAEFLLARGEPTRASQIGELMCEKFAKERAATHRSIAEWARKVGALDELSASIVRSLDSLAVPDPDDSPHPPHSPEEKTPVGDLGVWIEQSRADNPAAKPLKTPSAAGAELDLELNALARRPHLRHWYAALAAAVCVGAYFWLRPASTEPTAKPSAVAPPPSAAQVVPQAAAPPPVFSAPAAAAPDSAPVVAQGPARAARSASSRRASRPSAEASVPASASLSSTPRQAVPDAANPRNPEVAAHEAPFDFGESVPGTTKIGDDLRGRQKSHGPHSIDTVNPFR